MNETEMFKSKIDIKSLTLEELTEEIKAMGQQKFRAVQIYKWLHEKKVTSFDEMLNISEALREQLKEKYYIVHLKVIKRLESKLDETKKFLFELYDGNCVVFQINQGTPYCIKKRCQSARIVIFHGNRLYFGHRNVLDQVARFSFSATLEYID